MEEEEGLSKIKQKLSGSGIQTGATADSRNDEVKGIEHWPRARLEDAYRHMVRRT